MLGTPAGTNEDAGPSVVGGRRLPLTGIPSLIFQRRSLPPGWERISPDPVAEIVHFL